MSNFKFELGLQAEDIITGHKGIITGRCEHLTGCNTYGLLGKIGSDGKFPESQWFDENRIKIIKQAKCKIVIINDDPCQRGSCGNPKNTR